MVAKLHSFSASYYSFFCDPAKKSCRSGYRDYWFVTMIFEFTRVATLQRLNMSSQSFRDLVPCVPEKSRPSLWSITSVMLNGKTWFMRHSNGNDMAKQTCHIRRATQLALLTGGAQDEHPCAKAPWAGARFESAPLRCWIICGIWLASVLSWSLPWLLPYCNGLFACTRAFI